MLLVEHPGDLHGVLAADRDHGVEPVAVEGVDDRLDRVLGQRLEARRPQDRPAEREDARDRPLVELHVVALGEPAVAAHDPDRLVAAGDGRARDPADHGVQPRAVAAGGEHPDPHVATLSTSRPEPGRR